ncbi:MAG: hypothetical protein JNL02_06555 [Saprospiraceae bacterium]|nr:hypothetical protein [Saprospiraceae bacterium]
MCRSAYKDILLNDEERRLIEKLRDMPNFKPSAGKEDRGFFDKIRDAFNS